MTCTGGSVKIIIRAPLLTPFKM